MDYDQQIQAAMLRQRDASGRSQYQNPEGRMVSGRYVAPNFLEYLSAGLRSAGAGREAQMAGDEAKDLGTQKQKAIADALRTFGEKANPSQAGTGATGMVNDALPPEMQIGAMPKMAPRKPDWQGAYDALANSGVSELQKAGVQGALTFAQQQAQQGQKAQENQRLMGILQSSTPQQAIAAGVPAEVVKSYHESRNYGRDKVTFVDTGGAFTPKTEYGDVPANVAPISKTGNPFSDTLLRDGSGKIVPNEPLVGAKSRIAAAGAPRTSVSVNMPDKKFYEGLGSAVSGQIEKGFEQAQSAVQTLNNANQISQGLSKALVGPLANQRLTLAQIGQTLGVAGKDTTETLQKTREVIQGLARQELSAAGQMKGQGQITESERAILRKAEAGQINEFTKPELETFLGAIRKTAKSRIAAHERNMSNLGRDPQAGTILPYLQIEAPQDASEPSAGMPSGFKVVR